MHWQGYVEKTRRIHKKGRNKEYAFNHRHTHIHYRYSHTPTYIYTRTYTYTYYIKTHARKYTHTASLYNADVSDATYQSNGPGYDWYMIHIPG